MLGTFSSLPGELPGIEEIHSRVVWSPGLLGGYQAVIEPVSRARLQPGSRMGTHTRAALPSPHLLRPDPAGCVAAAGTVGSPLCRHKSERQAPFPAAAGEKESTSIMQEAKQARRKKTYLRS